MKVVCICDFDAIRLNFRENVPKKNGIYTVRARVVRHVCGKDYTGYLLNEVINTPREYLDGRYEVSFAARAFRPITDISDLIKLTKVRELEDA